MSIGCQSFQSPISSTTSLYGANSPNSIVPLWMVLAARGVCARLIAFVALAVVVMPILCQQTEVLRIGESTIHYIRRASLRCGLLHFRLHESRLAHAIHERLHVAEQLLGRQLLGL